jgi:hypothetical protein
MLEFGSEEIGQVVFQKVMALNQEADDIKAIAKKSGLEILELKDASYKESATILGNPTILLSMLSVAPEGEEPRKEKLREIVIGENEEGLFKVEETIFDGFVSVKKGTEEERNYLAQVILEDSIMDAGPFPVIFDFSKRSLKLDEPNPYPYDYARYGLASHNVAFKLRRYDLTPNNASFKINLNQMDPQAVWHLFGMGVDEPSVLIMQAISSMQRSNAIDGVGSIMEVVEKTPVKSEKDRSTVSRALRMLRSVGKSYGSIFSKDFDTLGIMAGWVKDADPVHISLSGLDLRRRLAFLYGITELFQKLKGAKDVSEVGIKRIDQMFLVVLNMDWFGSGLLQSEIVKGIVDNHKGALFSCDGDLPMQIESRVSHRFNVVGPGRAKLYLTGRGTEFDVRPLLSCPP